MPITKHDIRQEALDIRRNILSCTKAQAATDVLKILESANVINKDFIVAGYMPTENELNILPILHSLPHTALPCITDKDSAMTFRAYRQGDALEKNPLYNFMQPAITSPIVIPHIIFVPVVAFDRSGARLGMGGGYYDRTLAAGNFKTIGVAFSVCEVEKIPTESHDIHMDAILTEKEFININL